MRWRPFRHRMSELDARVEDAQRRAQDATLEAETSARRRKEIEKNIVTPLDAKGAHNQFAELIRQSLIINGNHRGNENA